MNMTTDKATTPNTIDEITAQRDALLQACKIAEATLDRLAVRHGPFSSVDGTFSVLRAAIALCERGEK